MTFARTIGIDYSGAETTAASLKGLRVYLAEGGAAPLEVLPRASARKYWTRRGIAEWLVERARPSPRSIPGPGAAPSSMQAAPATSTTPIASLAGHDDLWRRLTFEPGVAVLAKAPAPFQRLILLSDTPPQKDNIENREYRCDGELTKGKRERCDFPNDDEIIGMPDESIGSMPDQRRVIEGDDAGRPMGTKRGDDPQTQTLQNQVDPKREPMDFGVVWQREEHRQEPGCVQAHNEWIVCAADLDAALSEESARIS